MLSTQQSVEILWDYLAQQHPLQKADCILVLGNNDVRTADYAAKLMLQGWAKWICFTGGYGRLSRTQFTRPEAEVFAEVAISAGVPEQSVLIEPLAANTGENIQLTRSLFESRGITISSALVTTKPYLQRRALASCQQQWPSVTFRTAPVRFQLSNYPNDCISETELIEGLVGEMQRIMGYPAKGYIVVQAIPEAVMRAYRHLCDVHNF